MSHRPPSLAMFIWFSIGLICLIQLIRILFFVLLVYRSIKERLQAARNKGTLPSEVVEELAPKVTGNQLVMGTECAICLDGIESEQLARLIRGCNHGFHLECADAWLSKHSVCPICRAELRVDHFLCPTAAAEDNC